MTPLERRATSEWRSAAEWDWVELGSGERLHAVGYIVNDETVDKEWCGHGHTACGRGGAMYIPGISLRLGGHRCKRCCDVTGMPYGTGSPKNDGNACREIVEARVAGLGYPDE